MQLGHRLAGDRAGLEAVGPPADVDEEALDPVGPMIGAKSGVMSHSPAHWRSTRIFDSDGISCRTCPARSSMNSSDPRMEYEAYGSTLAPKTSSPRSVWLT